MFDVKQHIASLPSSITMVMTPIEFCLKNSRSAAWRKPLEMPQTGRWHISSGDQGQFTLPRFHRLPRLVNVWILACH